MNKRDFMVMGTSMAFGKPTTFNKIEQLGGFEDDGKINAFKSLLIIARLFNFIALKLFDIIKSSTIHIFRYYF